METRYRLKTKKILEDYKNLATFLKDHGLDFYYLQERAVINDQLIKKNGIDIKYLEEKEPYARKKIFRKKVLLNLKKIRVEFEYKKDFYEKFDISANNFYFIKKNGVSVNSETFKKIPNEFLIFEDKNDNK